MVYVNGEPVVNNDGLHGFRTRSGEIELEPGTYEIEVRYFENYGHAGLRLEWEGPDTDGRELVQAHSEFEIDQNGTFEVALVLGEGDGDEQIEITGLPPGTLVSSGEDTLLVDDQPTDISGWDLSLLHISPPPEFEGQIEGAVLITDTGFNGAEVTGETPFTFTVGDPNAEAQLDQSELLLSNPEAGKYEEDWTQFSNDDALESDDEVMSEAVENGASLENTMVALEVYERPEM